MAAGGNRASSYTVLGISVVVTLIVPRFPSPTLMKKASQGKGNGATGVDVIRKVKDPIFKHMEIIKDHRINFYFVQIL